MSKGNIIRTFVNLFTNILIFIFGFLTYQVLLVRPVETSDVGMIFGLLLLFALLQTWVNRVK